MSYCRINNRCDVYVYADISGGWTTHVTTRKQLPHCGQTFSDDTAGKCADRLESLRAVGYAVPQYAIDQLRNEPADDCDYEDQSP